MTRPTSRRREFHAIAAGDIDAALLPRAALLAACEVRPTLDVDHYIEHLARLGRDFERRLAHREDSLRGRVEALNDVLFEQEGFQGDTESYYDPRNSLLDQVIERRRGIPITLSVMFQAVAGAGGLQVEGVGLPGHFIVRAADDSTTVLVDPFHRGQILTVQDCKRRVETVTGAPARWRDEWLAPTPPRDILIRMLNNLKGIYLRATDFRNALWVQDLTIALRADDALQYRDRGLMHAQLQRYGDARRDLGEYLERTAGQAADAEQILEDLERLRRLHHMLN